ncbi:MAG: hypothetical protein HY208_05660 [Nitrospirae bacterium]|nr:hypothetical protein [Nitrospirota bacterium]
MKKEEMVKKNLDLLNEFMRYAFDHPDVLDKIPKGAEVVILPLDDPELLRENKKTAEQGVQEGKQVVVVKFRKPEAITPELELLRK